MIGVVVSRDDAASLNVRDRLLEEADWDERDGTVAAAEYVTDGFVMVEKEGLHLYYDGVDDEIRQEYDVGLLVFASRHSGDTGPLLTAHFTGNFGEAEYGGDDESLATPAPDACRRLLGFFDANKPDGFGVSLEATHHGPTELETPSLYAEVGSGEDDWENEEAARVVARGILRLGGEEASKYTLLGVGDGHYCPRFTRLELETDVAFGHVVPDYAFPVSDGLVREAFERSDADYALVAGDYKVGLPTISESAVRRRSGVETRVAESIEELLDGERLYLTRRARSAEESEAAVFGGTELAREARRVDTDGFDDAVDRHALGYSEDADGVLSRVVVGDADGLVDALVGVLGEKYDEVTVEGDTVVATRRVFSPEKARSLGVPEGPAFGRLSDGEDVEVDGRSISADDVTTTEKSVFSLSREDGE